MTINDCLGYISLKQEEVNKLRTRLESLEAENLGFKNQNTVLKYNNSVLKKNAAECKLLLEEKQQEGDNLRNRIKDLEAEIDRLKSNPSTVSDSELRAIHTADVETINKLNIRAHDVKKKVQQLKDIINDLSEEL